MLAEVATEEELEELEKTWKEQGEGTIVCGTGGGGSGSGSPLSIILLVVILAAVGGAVFFMKKKELGCFKPKEGGYREEFV